jgi:hypothetical protein
MTELPTDLGARILAATRMAVMIHWQNVLTTTALVTDDTPAPGQDPFPDHQQREATGGTEPSQVTDDRLRWRRTAARRFRRADRRRL